MTPAVIRRRVAETESFFGIESWFYKNVAELSGREQQRAALAKILLTDPDIILLDEPTKGLDAEFKAAFADILEKLLSRGVTVLMVSHDVSFCAEYAHRCGLFFDGAIVAEGTPREFFSGSSFYTTTANRMARKLIPYAVTVSDIIACCGGELPTLRQEPKDEVVAAKEITVTDPPKPMSVRRKAAAVLSLAVLAAAFMYAAGVADLSAVVNADGVSNDGIKQMLLYPLIICAMTVFIASVGKRRALPKELSPPAEKRKLGKRTKAALMLILLFIPAMIFVGAAYLGNKYYGVTSSLVLAECMIPFFLVFEGRKP